MQENNPTYPPLLLICVKSHAYCVSNTTPKRFASLGEN